MFQRHARRLLRLLAALSVLALHAALSGCALNGDFGRVRPELVSDDMHAWVGVEAARAHGIPASTYPLTDDERQLRDLAYPLIEPPYERNRWFSVLNEYGLNRRFQPDWYVCDVFAYGNLLMSKPFRSATARYNQLDDDIRNDVVRMDPFFTVARRVIDIDIRREKSLAHVTAIPEGADANARARIAENALIVAWVQQSLADRAESYRLALERLVVATPTPMAVEVERSIMLMRQKIAQYQIVAVPVIPRAPIPPRTSSFWDGIKRLAEK
jgi:hypothetical protein